MNGWNYRSGLLRSVLGEAQSQDPPDSRLDSSLCNSSESQLAASTELAEAGMMNSFVASSVLPAYRALCRGQEGTDLTSVKCHL